MPRPLCMDLTEAALYLINAGVITLQAPEFPPPSCPPVPFAGSSFVGSSVVGSYEHMRAKFQPL